MQNFLISEYFDNDEKIHAGFYIEHKEMLMHSHEFYEISYVYEGHGIHHFADGSSVPIKEGEFIFINPGTAHCITSPHDDKSSWTRVLNILISPEYMYDIKTKLSSLHELDDYKLQSIISDDKPFCLHIKDRSDYIYRLLMTITHEYNHFTHCSEIIIDNMILNLFISTVRLFENTDHTPTVSLIDDLKKHIRSNFASNLTLDYLAAYAHLSPEYLSRYFKKKTGMNISEFITKTRIDRAKHMLRTGSETINDVSIYCGYKSISNFQKAFKKATGISAGEYRKKAALLR